MKVFVLIGEYGEYEQHTVMVLGTFSSHELALAAVPKIKQLGGSQWKAHQERESRYREYLKRFEPDAVYPPGSPFPSGYTAYKSEHYKEAAKAVGPEPSLIPDCEKYRVVSYDLDAIEVGHELS